MRKLILLIITLVPTVLLAQTAERQVIGSTGGWATNSTMSASSSVGEVVIALGSSSTLTATQGFEQVDKVVSGINDVKTGLSVNAYPNPATHAITLDFAIEKPMAITIGLTDMQGRMLLDPQALNLTGNTKHLVSLAGLAAGQYLIHLSNADGTLNQTFQIHKVN